MGKAVRCPFCGEVFKLLHRRSNFVEGYNARIGLECPNRRCAYYIELGLLKNFDDFDGIFNSVQSMYVADEQKK